MSSEYEDNIRKYQELIDWLGLKNEPRTEEQIQGVLDNVIDSKFTEADVVWIMKLINNKKRNDDNDN